MSAEPPIGSEHQFGRPTSCAPPFSCDALISLAYHSLVRHVVSLQWKINGGMVGGSVLDSRLAALGTWGRRDARREIKTLLTGVDAKEMRQ